MVREKEQDIVNSLNYTLMVKTQIKEAIESKGVEVPGSAVFRDYPDLITEIMGTIEEEPQV